MTSKRKKIIIIIIAGIIAVMVVAGISFGAAFKMLSERNKTEKKDSHAVSKENVADEKPDDKTATDMIAPVSEESVILPDEASEEEALPEDEYVEGDPPSDEEGDFVINPNPDLSQYVSTDVVLDVTNTYFTKEMADMIVTDIRFGLTDVASAGNFVSYGRMLQGSNNEEYTYYGGNRNSLIESYYDAAADTVTPRLDGVFLNESEVQSFMQQQGVSESVAREALKKQYNIQYYNGLDCAFFNTIRLTAYAPVYSMETPVTQINEELRRLVHDLKKDLLILVRVQVSDAVVQYETMYSGNGYSYVNAISMLKKSNDANLILMYNILRSAIETNDTIKLNVLKMGYSNYQEFEDSLTE